MRRISAHTKALLDEIQQRFLLFPLETHLLQRAFLRRAAL
jgi:hypothetical protein